MADERDITRALLELQHLPNSPITDQNVRQVSQQYEADLGDIPAEILQAAVFSYRTSGNPFFPTSGQLREKATELLLISMDIPTASMAWSQVLAAPRIKQTMLCDDGERLFRIAEREIGGAYWIALERYSTHKDACAECQSGGYQEVYEHPLVARVVEMLGGRDRILTDNLTADRSQFIRAYTEIVMRETKLATMAPAVKETVQALQANSQMRQLGEGLRK